MYRGQMRDEYVQVWPREISGDGMGGEVSRFPAVSIEQWPCTIWRADVEHVRTDQGNMEIVIFGFMGDNAAIDVGYKLVRSKDGREYIVMRVFNEVGIRGEWGHLEGRMRHFQP